MNLQIQFLMFCYLDNNYLMAQTYFMTYLVKIIENKDKEEMKE